MNIWKAIRQRQYYLLCMALVSCVLITLWIRGVLVYDVVAMPIFEETPIEIRNIHSSIYIVISKIKYPPYPREHHAGIWQQYKSKIDSVENMIPRTLREQMFWGMRRSNHMLSEGIIVIRTTLWCKYWVMLGLIWLVSAVVVTVTALRTDREKMKQKCNE